MYEGNNIQDYELRPSFAKKLCMMSKSRVGELARDYFIFMEEKAILSIQPRTEEEVLQEIFPTAPSSLIALTTQQSRSLKEST
jgi:phage anti-repressor protein